MPGTPASAARSAGRRRAISASVLSCSTTYAGTPWSRDCCSRHAFSCVSRPASAPFSASLPTPRAFLGARVAVRSRRICTVCSPRNTGRLAGDRRSAPWRFVVDAREAERDELAEHAAPGRLVEIGADAEHRRAGRAPTAATRSRRLAAQHVDQVHRAEALAGAVDGRTAPCCAASVASQVSGGSRQVSQLPQGALASPK